MHVAFERGVGPDIERGAVGADPGKRKCDGDVEVGRKADRRFARRSAENANRLGDVLDPDVVFGKIGRAGKAAHRFSRDHADRADFAFGGRCDRVEAKQRAGRHHDLAAMLAGKRDEVLVDEERTGAQHDHDLAGPQKRLGDFREQLCRRAFDHDVG